MTVQSMTGPVHGVGVPPATLFETIPVLSVIRQHLLARVSSMPIIDRNVYVAKHGPARGLRRVGGLGWLPGGSAARLWAAEEAWLAAIEITGQTVYDIGGDQGLLTLCFAKKVGPRGRVVTIEPTARSAARIRANIAVNGFQDRCTVIEAACGAELGEMSLVVPRHASACTSADPAIAAMARRERGACDVIIAPVQTIDGLVAAGHPVPHLVKIDTEGFELPVLHGGAATIDRVRPTIYLENHGATEGQKRANIRSIVEWLGDRGYSMRHIESGSSVTLANADTAMRGHLLGEYVPH